MTKQVSSLNNVANTLSASRLFAAALLGLAMASFAVFPAQRAIGAHPPKTSAPEESVLVATHEEPATAPKNGDAPEGEALEPIAQSSDHNPEVAKASEITKDTSSQFGDALAKLAQPPKHDKAAKVAAEPGKNANSTEAGSTSGVA